VKELWFWFVLKVTLSFFLGWSAHRFFHPPPPCFEVQISTPPGTYLAPIPPPPWCETTYGPLPAKEGWEGWGVICPVGTDLLAFLQGKEE
jgi:hypothetical protein